jgi:hypothetical protein
VRRLPLPIALSTFSIIGCSSPAPPPAESPSPGGKVVRRADPVPPDRPEPEAEPEAPASGAPQARPEPLAETCEGPKIDLEEVFEVGVCQVEGKGERIPASISRSIEPGTVEVGAGKPARAAIRLENTGSDPADVFLSLPCELEDQVRTWIESASNRPVDTDRTSCEQRPTTGCLATVHQIRLPPGGVARFPFEATTTVRAWDQQCETHQRKGAVPRGRYKLRVRALFLDATLDADLVIR